MGYGKTDSKSTDEHDRQGALDPSLIPEDKPTERLNRRMKKYLMRPEKRKRQRRITKTFEYRTRCILCPLDLARPAQ